MTKDGFNYLYLSNDRNAYDKLKEQIDNNKIKYDNPKNQSGSVIYGYKSDQYTKLVYHWITNYDTFTEDNRHKQFINALAEYCNVYKVNNKNELVVNWNGYFEECLNKHQKEGVIDKGLTPEHAKLVGAKGGVNGQLYIFEGDEDPKIKSYLDIKEFAEPNNILDKINRLVRYIPEIEHARNFVYLFNEAIQDSGTNTHTKLSEAADKLKTMKKFPGPPFVDRFVLCKLPGSDMTYTVSHSAWIPQHLYDQKFALVLRSDNANVSNGEAWLASAGLFYTKTGKLDNQKIYNDKFNYIEKVRNALNPTASSSAVGQNLLEFDEQAWKKINDGSTKKNKNDPPIYQEAFKDLLKDHYKDRPDMLELIERYTYKK